jgi:ABC-type nitrate/sulfonate/bicarbonate transport system substrate-binding protein
MKPGLKASLFAALAAMAGAACAQEATLRVIVFPGSQNLPLLVGLERGVFAKHGVKVELTNTPNSTEVRSGLAAGKYDIAISGIDNAVAMVEQANADAVIVMGGDGGMSEFMVRPEVNGIADLKGKVIAVDAPNTAYALVVKKILKNNGLADGRDYTLRPVGGTMQRAQAVMANPELAATMSFPPFAITMRDQGAKSMGRTQSLIGPYQGGAGYVMRPWAQANADALERFIAAYVESVRIATAPANRAEASALLAKRFKLDAKVAEQTMDALLTPGFGLAPDARFDMEGFRTVLALRAEIEGQWGGKAPAPDKYLDLSYYERALKRLGAK